MASEGPNSPGAGATQSPGPGNDALGAWLALSGTISSSIAGSNNVSVQTTNTSGSSHVELSAKLVKGGSISGAEKATGAAIPGSDTYLSYGGSSDLHGLTLTDSDVNAANFGLAFAVQSTGGSGSEWLVATNFGFSIPAGATIDGVLAEVECSQSGNVSFVDHVRVTVYYTAAAGGQPAMRRFSQVRDCRPVGIGHEGVTVG